MYKVFGYDMRCNDFEFNNLTFTLACKAYMDLDSCGLNVVFIGGVSERVENKLRDLFFTHRHRQYGTEVPVC